MNDRTLLLVLSGAIVITGLLTTSPAILAQDDENPGVAGSSYMSPTWGYSFAWSDEWEVIASFADQAAGGVTEGLAHGDYLLLSAGLPNGNAVSLEIMAGIGYEGDPEGCLDAYVAGLESLQAQESDEVTVEGFQPAEADGQPIGGHDDLGAYGVFEYAIIGEEFHWSLVDYVDCRTIDVDDDTALLHIKASVLRENYPVAVPLIQEVLATLTQPDPADSDLPSPTPLRTLPPLDPLPEQPSTPTTETDDDEAGREFAPPQATPA